MAPLPDDLLTPGRELRETHTAWAVLGPEEVIKVKKPIKLDFVDFSTAALRRQACEQELVLNRRLAPETYLRTAPVTRAGRDRVELDGTGDVVDWAVIMKRLPDEERADVLLGAGRLGAPEVDRMARHVAAFHGRAAGLPDATAFASQAALAAQTADNLHGARHALIAALGVTRADATDAWQRRFVDAHGDLFEQRLREGRVRDQHGDLKLEHFYLRPNGGVTILDCVEFNAAFRAIDSALDLAFVTMDLRGHNQPRLAERFLSTYAQASGDYGLFRLIDFYESFRACVRAKTADLLAQTTPNVTLSTSQAAVSRHYAELAFALERPPFIPPSITLVGGSIGSGKSTLADTLALETGAIVLSSDATRKRLLQVDPLTRIAEGPFAGAYDESTTELVYETLAEHAALILASERPVVVDATFSRRRNREMLRDVAARRDVPWLQVECWANRATLTERLRRRDGSPNLSDGREELLDSFLAHYEPVTAQEGACVRINTEQSPHDVLKAVLEGVPAWPNRDALVES